MFSVILSYANHGTENCLIKKDIDTINERYSPKENYILDQGFSLFGLLIKESKYSYAVWPCYDNQNSKFGETIWCISKSLFPGYYRIKKINVNLENAILNLIIYKDFISKFSKKEQHLINDPKIKRMLLLLVNIINNKINYPKELLNLVWDFV